MMSQSRILATGEPQKVTPSWVASALLGSALLGSALLGSALLGSALLGSALLASCQAPTVPPLLATCDESPGALYQRRIAPLLATDRPSTCNACHAGGINLQAFARTTPCESMACLEQAGLVNLESPESSVLLSWIRRADSATAAVSEKLVAEEHDGFLEWIRHEAQCQECADVECSDPQLARCEIDWGAGGAPGDALPEVPSWDELNDPGGCDLGTLDALFRGTIYQNRGRCSPCHFADNDEATDAAPRFFSERGGCQVASLASENNILSRQLIDIDYPDSSLLLLKPLALADGGLPHGGDDKFTLDGDAGYVAFRHWVRRYAECSHSD
jgi:hypothetical protein